MLENKPASRNGNLLLCADSAGGHSRAVDARSASIEDTSGDSITLADLREADQLDVTGTRRGLGADSTLDATTITRVASMLPIPVARPRHRREQPRRRRPVLRERRR